MLVAGQKDICALDVTVGDALDLMQVAKASKRGLHNADRLNWGESDIVEEGVCQAAQWVVRRHDLDNAHWGRITCDIWRYQYGDHVVVVDPPKCCWFGQN